MTNILLTIYGVVGNFGIAIILFTILIRLATHPLMVKQIKSSQKMQELNNSKQFKEMQEKYKGNKEKLSQEQMKLYQEMGYNPLSGCLAHAHPIPHHHRLVSKHHPCAGSHPPCHADPHPYDLSLA